MTTQAHSDETRRGVTRWLVREPLGVVFVAITLFVPAGRLDWLWGWALVAVYAAWIAATTLLLIQKSPELLSERVARNKPGTKRWDTILLSVYGLLTIAKHVVAGLDVRYGWSQSPVWSQIVTLLIAALSQALVTWAMVANAYFAKVVRIQEERGQSVATGGPYAAVRHPGYLGTLLFECVTPILLGSWWALIPGLLSAVLILVRTALEDRTLQEELEGYQAYARQVRYRLIPGLW
jgi:protein-S-isoprenylcysteine O-methyltransferase Ste14